ncbi:hypothetical protein ACC760_38395, partial [Rhizobium ruizarguesonis]
QVGDDEQAGIRQIEGAKRIADGDNFQDRIGSKHLPENFRTLIVNMARGREWIWIKGNHDPDGIVDLPGASADEMHYDGLTFRHEPKNG